VANRGEVGVVCGAAVAQGLALVTFPAASPIFTSGAYYGLSRTEYGGMFLPQAVTAIAASLLGARLVGRWGTKRTFLVGLSADLLSMAVLLLSRSAMTTRPLAYAMLLLATGCLGIGFGLTVPALNTLVAAFFPATSERAVLILNALLGLGTVLAPVLVSLFIGLGDWSGLPLIVSALTLALLLLSRRLPLTAAPTVSAAPVAARSPLPARFWVFAGFATLYGVVETMNGNWAAVYMTGELGADAATASLALTAFWGMVTVGRVLFALIEQRFPERSALHLLPFVTAVASAVTAALPAGSPLLGVAAFGLAGLGCSALLPLTISFGQEELVGISASAAGLLIAFYQMGYGVAAFGVGPLEHVAGLDLRQVYGVTTIVALSMGALSFVAVPRRAASSRIGAASS
jgi:MFS family permease